MSLHPVMRAALAPWRPKNCTVEVHVDGCDAMLTVTGTYTPGHPSIARGENWLPAESACFEIESVCVESSEFDLTELLSDKVLDDIERLCREKLGDQE